MLVNNLHVLKGLENRATTGIHRNSHRKNYNEMSHLRKWCVEKINHLIL